MKLAIYSDCHLMAPHSVTKESPEILRELYDPKRVKQKYNVVGVFLTGDIIDRDNCKKKRLKEARREMDTLKGIHKENYIFGNHEATPPETYYLKKGNILFCHGHTLFWNIKKVLKWERKKGGMSYWRYKVYQWTHHSGRNGKPLKLSPEKALEIATKAKEHNCDVIIFGHTHRNFDETHFGVRIINVPKGRTIVEI